MPNFDVIAFDADDTLWHAEHLYADAQARFKQLLAPYRDPEWYVPYHVTWAHEAAEPPPADQPGYFQLEHLGLLPALIETLRDANPARAVAPGASHQDEPLLLRQRETDG